MFEPIAASAIAAFGKPKLCGFVGEMGWKGRCGGGYGGCGGCGYGGVVHGGGEEIYVVVVDVAVCFCLDGIEDFVVVVVIVLSHGDLLLLSIVLVYSLFLFYADSFVVCG